MSGRSFESCTDVKESQPVFPAETVKNTKQDENNEEVDRPVELGKRQRDETKKKNKNNGEGMYKKTHIHPFEEQAAKMDSLDSIAMKTVCARSFFRNVSPQPPTIPQSSCPLFLGTEEEEDE
ncbi:unnamed protein product [Calicophoron daubneyi]|uniref:Uncharacterized protein n=1 Tax=Calicophoron daubneyi TaxID=300641 RepID=A0AAV2T1B8_CALDB